MSYFVNSLAEFIYKPSSSRAVVREVLS